MSSLDDIAEKIGALLSDEESMNQIKELAAMFSGNSGEGQSSNKKQEDGGSGLDPLALIQLFGAASEKDKDRDLLLALKPHLSAEKQRRVDRAVKMLKLYSVFVTLRDSGMLNDLENML